MAQAKIESAFLKNACAKTLKAVLQDHAILLRQLGKLPEVEVLAKKSNAMVIYTELRNPQALGKTEHKIFDPVFRLAPRAQSARSRGLRSRQAIHPPCED